MSNVDPSVTPDPEPTPTPDPVDELPPVDPPADDDPDKGAKAALVAEREARRAEKAEARKVKAELDALRQQIADKDKTPDEQAIEQAKREARLEAQTGFNRRLVQAELKAALASKVNNPALALKVIDASVIDVGDDGEIDAQSVTDAIDALLVEYPELNSGAASRRRIPEVPADPANKPSTPASLSDRIAAAQKAGDTASFIALQNQLLQQQ